MSRPHPSHKTRLSDSSLYDEVCVYCGVTDNMGQIGRGNDLVRPCDYEPKDAAKEREALRLAAHLEDDPEG